MPLIAAPGWMTPVTAVTTKLVPVPVAVNVAPADAVTLACVGPVSPSASLMSAAALLSEVAVDRLIEDDVVGVPSIVGENGPELFTPGSSGTVIPNHALGGSQTATAYVTINLDGQTLATAVQTVLLQKNRGVPTLGFS